MKTLINSRVKNLLKEIQHNDPKLAKELNEFRNQAELKERADKLATILQPSNGFVSELADTTLATESIILKVGRPVLTIVNNNAQLILNAESETWRSRLEKAQQHLIKVTKATGRIELANHPTYDWVGTGWFVSENIIVTNRHVAEVFAKASGSRFVFRKALDNSDYASKIDLLEEAGITDEVVFNLAAVLYIEPEPGPDLAFFRVDPQSSNHSLPQKIDLSGGSVKPNTNVAVIGYPARDSRVGDQQLMDRLYGGLYDKKRLAPGQVTNADSAKMFHDCTTLGGCSGSPVIDLDTGEAVGLHFGGRYLESNYAVPSGIVRDRLDRLTRNTSRLAPHAEVPADDRDRQTRDDEDEIMFDMEARPEDYADRVGYIPGFLNNEHENIPEVPLPKVVDKKKADDVLYYDHDGKKDHVLRYEHFSVVMSISRRLCFFSAVNINGAKSRKDIERVRWRLDPRIPAERQVIRECYGNPPKFSRGHMTRREDPIWGKEVEAFRGNADSMVVTNAVPQMQDFNAGVWLELENYALSHARAAKMHISVFTGPIMTSKDRVEEHIKIPLRFWKVIAFIHDETGKLCATGYTMSQVDYIPDEEFVFGTFKSAQVPISWIERKTGLSFGILSACDPLGTDVESIAPQIKALESEKDIRFL